MKILTFLYFIPLAFVPTSFHIIFQTGNKNLLTLVLRITIFYMVLKSCAHIAEWCCNNNEQFQVRGRWYLAYTNGLSLVAYYIILACMIPEKRLYISV